MLAATTAPILPASWGVAGWEIDPGNVSGCASDGNSGTSSVCGGPGIGPLKTYQELSVHRWGCLGNPTACPRLRQATTVCFLSSQTDNSDPVYASPALEQTGQLALVGRTGSSQQIATGAITLVNAKNRTTQQLLQVTLPGTATLAAGLLVLNLTHPSIAWTYTAVAGRTWNMTQPMSVALPPLLIQSGASLASEIDTWATSDVVNVYQLASVNVAYASAPANEGTAGPGAVILYQLNVYDPDGIQGGTTYYGNRVYLGPGAIMVEAASQRGVMLVTPSNIVPVGASNPGFNNAFLLGGVVVSGAPSPSGAGVAANFATAPIAIGGTIGPNAVDVVLNGLWTGYDIILAGGSKGGITSNGSNIGDTYVETGQTLRLTGPSGIAAPRTDPNYILWGPGTLDLAGSARLGYPNSGSGAVDTLKIANITMNSQTKSCKGQPGAAGITIACNLTVSASQFDVNSGGTGCTFVPGGPSACAFAF